MADRRPRSRRIILDTGGANPVGGGNAMLVERFLGYVRHERALAENTQAAYGRDLRDFTAWLGGRPAAALDVRDLGDYFAALARKGLARASVCRLYTSPSPRDLSTSRMPSSA